MTLLEPAIEALRDQQRLTALQPKTAITFHHREYGLTEAQELKFVFIPRMKNGAQRPHYSLSAIGTNWNAAAKRAGIRRRNPYHTRHAQVDYSGLPARGAKNAAGGGPIVNSRAGQTARARRNAELSHF
ncbi:hypothetical protein PN657_002546 [Cronobacter dublinensis]|nr:hypothetical protein [Cronobacter dublinensis]EKF2291679.1 hypothetical protein [Cronobacter dublinensis]EKF2297155.1 hypothetical protein [Cronobacter dublinensis]EKK5269271.1 hypothetical protein [Cronobacter dublinensis]EKM0137774.1 hypothetical protein [Cronobacter dublinensis]